MDIDDVEEVARTCRYASEAFEEEESYNGNLPQSREEEA